MSLNYTRLRHKMLYVAVDGVVAQHRDTWDLGEQWAWVWVDCDAQISLAEAACLSALEIEGLVSCEAAEDRLTRERVATVTADGRDQLLDWAARYGDPT